MADSPAAASEPAATPPPLVLVVDDNAVTRYSTVRILTSAGFRTLEADTGRDAMARAGHDVMAMVLDINLPDVDGYEVCRILRARPDTARLPVVHLSAQYVQEQDKVKGLDAGANAYLTHPAEPAVLVATVAALIRANEAERAMRESEARLRAIYSQALGGICMLDREGRFVDVNPAMLSLLQRTPDDLLGRAVADFAEPATVAKVIDATGSAQTGGWEGSFPLLAGDGALCHFDWSISASLESGIKVALVSNATERVNMARERELLIEREQAARAGVERLNRMKDEFIAILSHELRNPLNVISVWTHILGRQVESEEGKRGLAAIERNVQIQQRLVADLVDVSMFNVGKVRLEGELVDPVEEVRAALHGMQPTADEKHITLALEVTGTHSRQWLDTGRFQQILWNLLSNAIKFSKVGDTVRVEVDAGPAARRVAVTDEGRGIAAEFLPLLFERFTQSDDAHRRKHGGLGLGLSIVKQLAEMHGGTVQASSPGLDQGSTFEVNIPVRFDAPPAASDESVGPDGQSAMHPKVPLDALDILVVEDDVDSAAALGAILNGAGADVRTAGSVDEALVLLGQAMPDLIISDIGLPGQDGYALMKEVRIREAVGLHARVPAIALTAFVRQQDRRLAMESGFDFVCAKPLNLRIMMGAIEQVLAGRR
jgi:PAS domain S-box-containing protein